MQVSSRATPILVAILLLASAVGCTTGPDENQAANHYSVPTTPHSDGQGSFIQFESGLSGSAHLLEGSETECTTNAEGTSRAFRASSTDFTQFDRGSARPGDDFALELLFGPTHITNEAGQKSDYLSLKYVDRDGVHHDLTALDQLEIQIVDAGFVGAGFSATTGLIQPAYPGDVTVTGFIKCSSVTEVAGPVL